MASLYSLSSQAGCSEPRRASTRGRAPEGERNVLPGRGVHVVSDANADGTHYIPPIPPQGQKLSRWEVTLHFQQHPQCNQVLLTRFVLKPKRKQCLLFPGSSAPGTHVGTFGPLRAEATPSGAASRGQEGGLPGPAAAGTWSWNGCQVARATPPIGAVEVNLSAETGSPPREGRSAGLSGTARAWNSQSQLSLPSRPLVRPFSLYCLFSG